VEGRGRRTSRDLGDRIQETGLYLILKKKPSFSVRRGKALF